MKKVPHSLCISNKSLAFRPTVFLRCFLTQPSLLWQPKTSRWWKILVPSHVSAIKYSTIYAN